MKKIISNLDKSVRDNSRITHSDGLWRSEHSPESYDLWGGDTPNELLNQIFYWPAPNDVLLPLWPYYYIENRRCDQQWFRHFNIPNLAITLVLEGRIEYTEDNQSVIVGPGEVMLQMPGSSHRMINADEKPTHKLVVLLSGWGKEMFSNAPGFHSSGKVVLKNHTVIEKKMRQIGKLIKQKSPGGEFLLSEKGYGLWLELLRQQKAPALPEELEKIMKFLEKKKFIISDMEELLQAAGISHSTLLRLFKKHFNSSPHAFLISKRLERSTALLSTGCNVKEAARQCGFEDAAHFSRLFKKKFGMAPVKYKP